MRRYILFFIVFFLPAFALADDVQQVITLKDGSQIKGVLSGIQDGVYVVKTPIIGDVHVAAKDVASITNGNAASPAGLPMGNTGAMAAPAMGASPFDQQLQATQQQLMSNPQNMQLITEMAQDPQIMQALQDPAVMAAINNHDYQALANTPAIKELMTNPHMQELIKQMQQQQQQGASQ
ncbi:MAG: hypothetical protein KGK03_03765 [Candidatus Omnitrophica bacterium]|nr:hypothetical protein [Candidatus Omnitrophota bacterium]MDE2222170.1 hypothetical protein [Candidatus Omnitrophota bacterium]